MGDARYDGQAYEVCEDEWCAGCGPCRACGEFTPCACDDDDDTEDEARSGVR